MSRSVQTAPLLRSGIFSSFWQSLSNFVGSTGFGTSKARNHRHNGDGMPPTARHQRSFLSLRCDFAHRRKYRRRLTNVILVPVLSLLVAYVITRPTGGAGFNLPKSLQRESASPANSPAALPQAAMAASVESDGKNLAIAAFSKSGYKLAEGPYKVTEASDVSLRDKKRNKVLHLRVFYPNDPGPFPVIVFSHGAGGSQNCCDTLTRHWASYGYVMLQPTHDDSTTQRRNSGEGEVNSLRVVREALKKPALWESRPEDISFVLDSFAALQSQIPGLAGKLDANHIGVGGHSMGAFAADAIAGALVDLPGRPATSFMDKRVKAALLLSPQGPGEFGLNDHSWDGVSLPLLSMTGSLDMGANREAPGWRRIPFDRSEPGDKYHVFIEGANHTSFMSPETAAPARAAPGEAIFDYANSASLAFWDAYLKADSNAKQYLQSNALAGFSHGAVTLLRR